MITRYLRLAAVFLLAVAVCFLLELTAACIPQRAIQKNCEQSALYYRGRTLFQEKLYGYENTTIDYYADCLLLNLAYEMDSTHPVSSVIHTAYYDGANQDTATDLLDAVFHQKPANTGYGRYWHGSIISLRPLLVCMDIKDIYRLLKAVTGVGVLLVMGWLLYKKQVHLTVCFSAAFLLAQGFFMPFCIEYANVMLITLCMIPLFVWAGNKGTESLCRLCIIDGVVTCFMDFLTAETLTVTLPLFVFLLYAGSLDGRKEAGQKLRQVILGLVCWGISYSGMFLIKWLLSSLFDGTSVLTDTAERAGEYMQGNPLTAIRRNIGMLLWIRRDMPESIRRIYVIAYIASMAGMAVCLFSRFYKGQAMGLGILALVPYLRFAILSGHSLQHCFFTFRSQMVTLCVLFVTADRLLRQMIENCTHRKENSKRIERDRNSVIK